MPPAVAVRAASRMSSHSARGLRLDRYTVLSSSSPFFDALLVKYGRARLISSGSPRKIAFPLARSAVFAASSVSYTTNAPFGRTRIRTMVPYVPRTLFKSESSSLRGPCAHETSFSFVTKHSAVVAI